MSYKTSNIWLGNRDKCLKSKTITQWWKDVHNNLRVILNVARMGMGLLQNYFWISSGKCFLFYLQDTQIEIMVNKKASLRVSHELNKYLRYLHQDQNLWIGSLSRRYPQFSFPTIWRHATKKMGGRKRKLSLRDERSIIRSLHYARKQDGNFSSKRIRLYSGVSSVHDRTVPRALNKYGYHYQQARRKGLLTENDLKLHMK